MFQVLHLFDIVIFYDMNNAIAMVTWLLKLLIWYVYLVGAELYAFSLCECVDYHCDVNH